MSETNDTKETMDQFILWKKEYDWGVVFIGPDVSGLLIMYGVNIGKLCHWHSELCKGASLYGAIERVNSVATMIGKDPSGYIAQISKAVIC